MGDPCHPQQADKATADLLKVKVNDAMRTLGWLRSELEWIRSRARKRVSPKQAHRGKLLKAKLGVTKLTAAALELGVEK